MFNPNTKIILLVKLSLIIDPMIFAKLYRGDSNVT